MSWEKLTVKPVIALKTLRIHYIQVLRRQISMFFRRLKWKATLLRVIDVALVRKREANSVLNGQCWVGFLTHRHHEKQGDRRLCRVFSESV